MEGTPGITSLTIVPVEKIECLAGRGIRGDRFSDYKRDYQGQITFFALEVIEALARELNLTGLRPDFTRRNVFTRGVDLNTFVGVEFEVQGHSLSAPKSAAHAIG